jgi:hypothetical protein
MSSARCGLRTRWRRPDGVAPRHHRRIEVTAVADDLDRLEEAGVVSSFA